MNQLQVFKNEQFGDIRVLERDGEPWFVLSDVCRALDIGNNRKALVRLDEDEKMTIDSSEGHSGQRGGAQKLNVVNESGLYSLVLGSRKPEAKSFKRWITHDVIPAICKTGFYSMAASPAEQLLAQAQLLVDQEKRLKTLEQRIEDQIADIRLLVDTKANPTVGMDWYTITGYIALKKYRVRPNDYSRLGKEASRLSKEKGYLIGTVPHPICGEIVLYSSDILDEVFARYDGVW